MQSVSKNITVAGTAFALFCPGLGLFYYACLILGYPVPFHAADYIIVGIAIAGMLSEVSENRKSRPSIFFLGIALPALLLTCLLFHSLPQLIQPLNRFLPGLMQARPIIYFSVAALWLSSFGRPAPDKLSFFSAALSILVISGFILQILKIISFSHPGGIMGSSLISISLLCGLCATFDPDSSPSYDRLLILTGILCSLNRHTGLIGVMVYFLFTHKNWWKKLLLFLAFLVFTYISIIVQDTSLLNENDIPTYWIWAAGIKLIVSHPHILLTGMPFADPLPFNVPTSLWRVWYDQQQVWTDFGVFLFDVRPFWLNIVLSWGISGLLLCVFILTYLSRKFDTPFCQSLIFSLIITASFEPTFNSAAEALILFTSFFAACREKTATKPQFTFS